MTNVRIPFYRVKKGCGYWEPKPYMREAGMVATPCGPNGPEAWAKAIALTKQWEARKKEPVQALRRAPAGSLDEAFQKYRATEEWEKKAPRTREEWERAWARLRPIFGAYDPKVITLAHISMFRENVARTVSQREAHRCIKIWRALWRIAAALGYCVRDADPSLGVRNTEPKRRQEFWIYDDARALVKAAWRAGYYGLAAVIAVAWDTSLSPVDVRTLTPAQRTAPDVFALERAKTGRAAVGTLSHATRRLLDAYLAGLGAELTANAPIFRNRSGAPYSKDTLGDDFRDVRALIYGEEESRTLADFRRSGAMEALKGGATKELVGQKMANDFASSAALQKTYAPVDLPAVREVDKARVVARKKARE